MERLCETYDACMSAAGTLNDEAVLIPVAHSTANAQIELFLDENGNIVKDLSGIVEKNGKNEITIIPVTEDSSCRTNANMPHPLHDKLCYVAGDYAEYTGEIERIEYYRAYIKQLTSWCESPYGNEYTQIVLKYLETGTLIKDLVDLGFLILDENGKLNNKSNKIHGLGQTGAFIRFALLLEDGEVWKSWESKELFDAWEKFYVPQAGFDDICFVTGKMEKCASKHPNKIRNSGDKAKLISGNDKDGFTFRGRFLTKDEAATVGYVASQKAHNALRWLVQRQGYKKDGSAIVIWKIPDTDKPVTRESFSVPDIFDINYDYYTEADADDENTIDTGKEYARAIERALLGREPWNKEKEPVIVMAIDAATQGRMSIEYYQEFGEFEYLESVKAWYEKTSWNRVVKDYTLDKYVRVNASPSPREIALAAYGRDKGGYLDADGARLKYATKRIIPVILGLQQDIPKDIERAVFDNVKRTHAYSQFLWEQKVLAVAYALLKRKGAFEKMKEYKDINEERSALWGKLLAILDEIETRSMYIADSEKTKNRPTNAKKYWSKYSRTPMSVYNQLYKFVLQAYARRLKKDTRDYFEYEIGRIVTRLHEIDGFNNQPLNEYYLVGYYEQKEAMLYKKKPKESEDE